LGRSVFSGAARQPDVLKSLDVGEAGLVIVTVDDFHAAEQVVSSLNRTFPALEILARGHNLQHCQILRSEGAGLVVSENLEASIALAQAALTRLGSENAENDMAIEKFRGTYYAATEKRK
jgi:voltage-gated potassium channel Kch